MFPPFNKNPYTRLLDRKPHDTESYEAYTLMPKNELPIYRWVTLTALRGSGVNLDFFLFNERLRESVPPPPGFEDELGQQAA